MLTTAGFGDAQVMVPAAFLVVGGALKVFDRHIDRTIAESAVSKLLPSAVVKPAWVLASISELLLGLLLLVPRTSHAAVWGAVAWGIVALTYTLVSLRVAPESGCGCFGSLSKNAAPRIGAARSVGFLAFVVPLALLSSASGPRWETWSTLLAVLETVVIILVAVPEIRTRLNRGRSLATRPDCATSPVGMDATVRRLHRSKAWREAQPYLVAAAPEDQWRAACWRYFAFRAVYEGSPATAVFSVYLGDTRKERQWCRFALVEEETQGILASA